MGAQPSPEPRHIPCGAAQTPLIHVDVSDLFIEGNMQQTHHRPDVTLGPSTEQCILPDPVTQISSANTLFSSIDHHGAARYLNLPLIVVIIHIYRASPCFQSASK